MRDHNRFAWKETLLFFCIPGAWIYLNMRVLLPVLLSFGWHQSISVYLCLWLPIILEAMVVLAIFRKSEQKFEDFFWFSKLSKRDWVLVALGFVFVQLSEVGTKALTMAVPALSIGSAPSFYPDLFQPDYLPIIPLQSFMGMTLKGNWYAALFWVFWLLANIGGEELLWRGYALPRMESYFGKWAWLVNGLLWNIVIHGFMSWTWISLIPISFIVPYLSQKTRSMWPGIVIHGLGIFLVFLILIPSII